MLAPTPKADDFLFSLLDLRCLPCVVDVGSNSIDGGSPSYRGMLADGLCRVFGFEPHPEALKKLQDEAGQFETYLPYAIGSGAPGTLHICSASGMTSLLRPDPERLALLNMHSNFGTIKEEVAIETVRLDDVSSVDQVDMLKVDAQGGELDIFNGAEKKLQGAVVVQTEVSLFRTYVGQPSFSDIDRCLRGMGFILHCFLELKRWPISPAVVDGNPRKGLRQAIEAEVVYVRDWTIALPVDQLKMLAALAHHVYQSYDLALRAIVSLAQAGAVSQGAPAHYAAVLRGMP